MPGIGRRFVIVGGAGLLGSALARALAGDGGADVVVCDTLGPEAARKWAGLPARLDDLWQPQDLMTHLDRDWRHIAGVAVLADSGAMSGDAGAMFDTAFHLPRAVWRFAAAKQKPVLWGSSLQVHGRGPGGQAATPDAIAALQPETAFGHAKRAFDLFAARHRSSPDDPPVAIGARLGSVYAADEPHKGPAASLPARALRAARAGAPVPLWRSVSPDMADGGHSRDWVHADDAGAMLAGLMLKEADGFFDVGIGTLATGHDVARAAGQVALRQVAVGYVEPPEGAWLAGPAADLSALAAAGIAPRTRSLVEGLAAA